MSDHELDVSSATVLVVDDEHANLTLIRTVLERAGYDDLHLVSDPREAVPTFEATQPDLVLLDLHMPHVDGFALMERLTALVPSDSFLPVLVSTADASPGTRRRALAEGADDFLLKPLDPTEVVLRVRNLLRTRRLHLGLRDEKRRLDERVQRRTEDLRKANEALVVSDQIKTDFMSMASHEMRTPLTVLKGFTEVMLRRWRELDGDRIDDQLRAMERNVVRLERLVNDLLLATRIETADEHGHEAVHVRAATFEIGRSLRGAVAGSDLDGSEVVVSCPDGERVTADEGLLEQIVTNLLVNADKYGSPPVEIHCRATPDTLEIVVRDHGAGVPEEFVPRLFERFTQASVGDRRTASGMGLGLWVARGLARLHGGDLTYEPAVPNGACFRVRVPQLAT